MSRGSYIRVRGLCGTCGRDRAVRRDPAGGADVITGHRSPSVVFGPTDQQCPGAGRPPWRNAIATPGHLA